MDKTIQIIILGIIIGTAARIYMLRTDYRQYPSYPHGIVVHVSLGVLAAALASLAIPALMEKEYTAITFLSLATQQFREIRNMERETLSKLEELSLVPRGLDYIEGIAKVFEARNYLVMFTSLVTTSVALWLGLLAGIIAGITTILISMYLMRGRFVRDIATVKPGKLHFENSLLMVDDIVIMNVGLEDQREKILKDGIGVVVHPKNDNGRAILNNLGQRQAILHDVSILVGNKLEVGEPDLTPLMRKDVDTGKLALFVVPNEKDLECVIEAIYRTPILESAAYYPLKSTIGKSAAD